MSMKSKLATTALLALVATGALATTNANAFVLYIPENATRFCDDVTFSCGTQIVPQETRRYQSTPPRHGSRPVPARTTARDRTRPG